MPIQPGTDIGRYHILEQLGEGGMAVVYKAYDKELEREVAIKVIRTEQFHSVTTRKRFEREARTLAHLTHANIVATIGYGDFEDMPYLVMPFIPGGTLKQKLGAALPVMEAAQLLSPIARALAYAHMNGVVHRDVKPSNILITDSGDPMLSDFGVAKILESDETMDLTATGLGIGTPEYMAPEQASEAKVGSQADIYSLGIIFYELVTGRKPFRADTPLAVLLKHVNEPLPSPRDFVPSISKDTEYVLLKALAKDPKNRFQSMDEFADALEKLVDGESIEERKTLARKKTMTSLIWAVGAIAAVTIGIITIKNLNWFGLGAKSAQGKVDQAAPTAQIVETATPLPTPTPEPLPYKWARVNSLSFVQRDSIKAIAVDPNDKEVIYVGMEWAGLYKSVDGGISWRPIQQGLRSARIRSMVINPDNSNIIYVGAIGGFFKSTNGGETWEHKTNGMSSLMGLMFSSVHLDPNDSNHLLYLPDNTLYESFDGGENWDQIDLAHGCPNYGSYAFFSPNSTEIIFIERNEIGNRCEPGVYVSDTLRTAWASFPIDFRYESQANFDGDHLWQFPDGSLIASVVADDLVISHDQGKNWELLSDLAGKCRVVQPVITEPGTLYCGYDNIIFKSYDFGNSWSKFSIVHPQASINILEIYIDPHNSNFILAGGNGLFKSIDGGKSWEEISNGLGNSKFITFGNPMGESIYLESRYWHETYFSEDYGVNWIEIEEDGYDNTIDAENEYLYRLVGNNGKNRIRKYSLLNGGVNDIPIYDLNLFSPTIHANPVINDNVIIADTFRPSQEKQLIYLSTDGGITWEKSGGIDDPKYMYGDLFFDLNDGRTIYDGLVARSLDAGKNWEVCDRNFQMYANIDIDPNDSNHVFAAIEVEGMYESADGCKHWKPMNNGFTPLMANNVKFGLDDPNIIYTGTDNGFYISLDGGESWEAVNDGLYGGLVIYSLYIDPISHNLFAITPLGIFRLEDK